MPAMQPSSNIKRTSCLTQKYMKESNTVAGNATIKQLQRDVLLDTKGQYMKKSKSFAVNTTIMPLIWDVLLNTKGP